MSDAQWAAMTVECVSTTTDSLSTAADAVRWGTQNISTVRFADGGRFVKRVGASSGFVESTKDIFIGGMPLALAESQGRYALLAIEVEDATISPVDLCVIDGSTYRVCELSDNSMLFGYQADTENSTIDNETVISGMPIAMSGGTVVFKMKDDPTIDATGTVYIGGMPFQVLFADGRWHLGVSELA